MVNFTKSSLDNVDLILQCVQNGQNHVQIVFIQAPCLRHWTLFLKYICDQNGHLHALTVNTSQNIQKTPTL